MYPLELAVFNEDGNVGQTGPPVCLGQTTPESAHLLAPLHLHQVDSFRCTGPKCVTWDTHSLGSLPLPVTQQFESRCQQISPLIFS